MLKISNIKKISLVTLALLLFGASFAFAGVGGGVEVRETVDIWELVKFTAVFLLGISAPFGIGLAFAAKKFAVKEDPRCEQVSEFLDNAHFGACAFPGCTE